jgi:hypothetical protein
MQTTLRALLSRSLVRFENKNNFYKLKKNALAYYNAGDVVVNFKAVGFAPGAPIIV